MRKVWSLLSLFLLIFTLAACRNTEDIIDDLDEDSIEYTVSFDTSGGSNVNDQVLEEGSLVSKPQNPTREEYIFTGNWLYDGAVWDFSNDTVSEDMTLVAEWVGVNEEVATESVNVTTDGFILPEANNAEERFDIELGSEVTFTVDFIPHYATNQDYTISTSNSRAEVEGNTVTFVYGITGPGNVSVIINFDDNELSNLEYRFKTVPAPTSGIIITDVTVDAGDFTLPSVNNSEDRPRVAVGTEFTLTIDILPENAANKNYTVSSSNSRAEVEGHTVTFVYGESGPGNVSIRIFFEDSSVGNAGMLEYRFETFEEQVLDIEIDTVTVTAGDFTLPNVNDTEDRIEVEIGTSITLDLDILPVDASNQNYTITTSNSRASAEGHTVSFIYGNTGPGNVSVFITFEDSSVGESGVLEYRFLTVEGEAPDILIDTVTITTDDFVLPNINDADDRPMIAIGSTITLDIDILPVDASVQTYTITTSNSRAEVEGHTVTFLYGNTGPGRVSIRIYFDDLSVGDNGLIEYRFETFEDEDPIDEPDVLIDSVTVTAGDFTLPTVNDVDDRMEVEIGTEVTLDLAILPLDASNQNYTITTSNSRAVADNHSVTFVFGNTGPGSVSILITFEDTSVGDNGVLNYRFTTVEGEAPDILIDTVTVTAGDFTLPNVNDSEDRPQIGVGASITLDIDILPVDASNQNYTITTSNSRAVVEGHTINFVYGNTGPGNVSIKIFFEDASVGDNGLLEYRFETIEIPVSSVNVTAGDYTLPEANNAEVRQSVEINTHVTLDIDILPLDASYQNYTISTSNSRAVVVGNTVTFVYGNTGPGSVSILVTFEDTSVGDNGVLNYRFTTVEGAAPVILIDTVNITADEVTLPNINDTGDRPEILIGTSITLDIDILPIDASNQNYLITTSNSRAEVDGHTITFVYGDTGPGFVSIRIYFEDLSVGNNGLIEFRFSTIEETQSE